MSDNAENAYNDAFGSGDSPFPGMPPGLVIIAGGLPNMLGGPVMAGEEVEYHAGNKILVPQGMSTFQAMKILENQVKEAETVTEFTRTFNYRADDGAVAASRVLTRRYGQILGESIDMGPMGGIQKPQSRTVATSYTETVQVPWGKISLPGLDGVTIILHEARHRDYGFVFGMYVEAANKFKPELENLFADIEEELRTNSIYRGKAVVGSHRLEFLDVGSFNAGEIVFAESVTEQLEGIWAVLRYTEAFRKDGIRTKLAALLTGPYGCGKSSTGLLTAQIATENNWTFVSAKAGEDRVEDVLKTAKLYMPAVVFIEDIDTQSSSSDDDEVSRLLEAFDGITAKGGELVVILTTNHKERIHKGMLRPGRLDAVIDVDCLDRTGVERLIRAIVPAGKLDDAVNYDEVFEAMTGFYPAFVRGALERAKTFAVSRGKGDLNYVLTTEDLVRAAKSLHPQLQALHDAQEGERKPTLDKVVGEAVTTAAQQAVHGTEVAGMGAVLQVPALSSNGHGRH